MIQGLGFRDITTGMENQMNKKIEKMETGVVGIQRYT